MLHLIQTLADSRTDRGARATFERLCAQTFGQCILKGHELTEGIVTVAEQAGKKWIFAEQTGVGRGKRNQICEPANACKIMHGIKSVIGPVSPAVMHGGGTLVRTSTRAAVRGLA